MVKSPPNHELSEHAAEEAPQDDIAVNAGDEEEEDSEEDDYDFVNDV